MMRKVLALSLVCVLTAAAAAYAKREVVEAVMIRVGERVVTIHDFLDRLKAELAQRAAPIKGEELSSFARRLFDAVLDEQVFLERAEEKGIEVTDKEVDQALENLKRQNNITDDAAFEAALRQSGLSLEVLRARYRQSILIQRVLHSELGPIEVTAEELKKEYEKRKDTDFKLPERVVLEQVFFPYPEGDDAAAKEGILAKAKRLAARVRKGSDLKAEATLAGAEFAELGEIPVADLREGLKEKILALDEGGVTDPMETSTGVQILRLVKRLPAGYRPFDEVKDSLQRQITSARYEQKAKGLVAKLKKRYLVETHPEYLEVVLRRIMSGE